MSTKSTIFLTKDNEHCYFEMLDEGNPIILEFDKSNITIIENDKTDLIVQINPQSEIYNIFKENMCDKWRHGTPEYKPNSQYSEYVIIFSITDGVKMVESGYYAYGKWYSMSSFPINVIKWMPFPAS